jgi:hypothetical protein
MTSVIGNRPRRMLKFSKSFEHLFMFPSSWFIYFNHALALHWIAPHPLCSSNRDVTSPIHSQLYYMYLREILNCGIFRKAVEISALHVMNSRKPKTYKYANNIDSFLVSSNKIFIPWFSFVRVYSVTASLTLRQYVHCLDILEAIIIIRD